MFAAPGENTPRGVKWWHEQTLHPRGSIMSHRSLTVTCPKRHDVHTPRPRPSTHQAVRHTASPKSRSQYLLLAAQSLAPYVPLIIDIGRKAGWW